MARRIRRRKPELPLTAEQADTVAALLVGPDDVDPGDVVLLSPHRFDRSRVSRALGGRFPPDRRKRRDGHIHFSSIRAFKALESPAVVLCELEDLDEHTACRLPAPARSPASRRPFTGPIESGARSDPVEWTIAGR